MNNAIKTYDRWKSGVFSEKELYEELKNLSSADIEDRFYKNLDFGTGGLRGILGAGTNRMNVITVGKATQGLANYLNKNHANPKVAIAFDSRIKSTEFAEEAAKIFAANKIQVYLFSELMPTPLLSFAVRELECTGGVMITASHNPAKYNGYKVYSSDGCQITLGKAEAIQEEINKVDEFIDVRKLSALEVEGKKWIHPIESDLIEKYLEQIRKESLFDGDQYKEKLKIVYSPLNGAGLNCVKKILIENGYTNLKIVPSQEFPDGNFPTCPSPNPEREEAMSESLILAKEMNSDLCLATDPDCDRVGVAVRDGLGYSLLSGNETGILLFDYICSQRVKRNQMPSKPIVIKTIVTTDMTSQIANKYGVEVIDVLTGFKFIGEQIGLLESMGESNRFIFGFEESNGYLTCKNVRDKDGVNAVFLIAEMAAYNLSVGKTLYQRLDELYEEFGFFSNRLKSLEFDGLTGMKSIAKLMEKVRNNPLISVGSIPVEYFEDYMQSVRKYSEGQIEQLTLPKSDVIKLFFLDGASVVIRPSGTEPKLKIYISASATSKTEAEAKAKRYEDYFVSMMINQN